MSDKGLAAAAARFLDAGERHDAARGRRKKTSTRKPRRARPVESVEFVAEQVELVTQLETAWSPSEDVATVEMAAVFGPVAAAEVTEQVAEQAEASERPTAYVDPFETASADPEELHVEESVWAGSIESIDAPDESQDDDEFVPEAEASSPLCPDCDLPIEADTDQCPHCALFLPRAA